MGYERYPRGSNPQDELYGRRDPQYYGRDDRSGRDQNYAGARDYQAAGGANRDGYGQSDYGRSDRGNAGYGYRDRSGQGYSGQGYSGQGYYGQRQDQARYDRGGGAGYHGSYASDGRRFEDVGDRRDWDDDNRARDNRFQSRDRGAPQGYDYEDRGFFARAGDEVRSWFGDEDAEHRRDADVRQDERDYRARSASDRDTDYGSWRSGQIAALDRDYDEYRREHRSKFEKEFSSWRESRQSQRDSLGQVAEHMDVVGSDGAHVGTVDKVRGDRILLTKNDADAGGRHHSIPSNWITTVDGKVTLSKTADEAKKHWRDEERNSALFGDRDEDADSKILNRSFSGTY